MRNSAGGALVPCPCIGEDGPAERPACERWCGGMTGTTRDRLRRSLRLGAHRRVGGLSV